MWAPANTEVIKVIEAEKLLTKIEDKSFVNNENVNYMAKNKSLVRITDENG
jgi:hypothetical protein